MATISIVGRAEVFNIMFLINLQRPEKSALAQQQKISLHQSFLSYDNY